MTQLKNLRDLFQEHFEYQYLLSNLKNCFSLSMSGSGPTCFALFKDINIATEVFEQNKKIFKNNGFDAWVCKLINSGITFF